MSMENRVALGLGAVVILAVSAVLAFAFWLAVFWLTPGGSPGTGTAINPKLLPELLTLLTVLCFFVASLSTAYLLWDRSAAKWRRGWLYGLSVVIVGSFSWTNFLAADTLVPIWWQLTLNLLLAICGTIAIAVLWPVQVSLVEGRMLKYLSIAALLFGAVTIPIMFDLGFLAYKLGVSNSNTSFVDTSTKVIAALAGFASLVIAFVKYEDDKKKDSGSSRGAGRVIKPR